MLNKLKRLLFKSSVIEDTTQENEDTNPLPKRYVEEYLVSERVIVGKLVVELKIEDHEVIYHELEGRLVEENFNGNYFAGYALQQYMDSPNTLSGEEVTYNVYYEVGFNKLNSLWVLDKDSRLTPEKLTKVKECLIQEELLRFKLGKENIQRSLIVEVIPALDVYRSWAVESFKNKFFLIKDEYFNPAKVISCKVFSQDKEFSIEVKRKAFVVKESKNETWLHQ